MLIAGVDLAWQSEKNATAIALGSLDVKTLSIEYIAEGLYSLKAVIDTLLKYPDLQGIAIDAPLVIPNETGQRECEKAIGRQYGSRKASCHTSNLKLYPNAASVQLSKELEAIGFEHLGEESKWQLECYPHPALIELFGLEERLLYKKGSIVVKRNGQKELAQYIKSLASSTLLKFHMPEKLSTCLESAYIESLRGKQLKQNEDLLDAIICLYIAGFYAKGFKDNVFGSIEAGYIYVPNQLA